MSEEKPEEPAEAKKPEETTEASVKAPEESTEEAKPEAPKAEASKAETAKPEAQEAKAPEASGKEESAVSEDEEKSSSGEPKRKLMKGAKNITSGVVHIKATFNNTQVSISDPSGAVISWSSAGKCGFKGSRKSTAYAATLVAQDAARAAQQHGLQEVEVQVQGPGSGRESAIRAIQSVGINVTAIRDVTPVPHNGCRPRKRRRV